jgi:hypothetical protein
MRSPLLKAGLFAVSSIMGLAAQQPSPSQEEPIHTLHVYTDLVQVPTLVLAGNHEPLKTPIPENRFSVSIDYGPWFRVTHVRREGNDPISLAILLDPTGAAASLMPRINDAIAALAPSSLTTRDHISIYAMDCGLTRSLNDVPLESWKLHQKNHTTCKQSAHLWDAIRYIDNELYKLPGRRVLLVVTDGRDRGSTISWNEVRTLTQATGVTVFGFMNSSVTEAWNRWVHQSDADSFQTICELSGGMIMTTSPGSIAKTLERSITLLRERYIVEFPRPSNSTKGEHDMRVKIANSGDDFIRMSGITVPLPDPALLANPTTVPSDPSHAPEQGQRHILQKPN